MKMTILQSEAENYIRLRLFKPDDFILEKAKEFFMSPVELAIHFDAPICQTELLTIKVRKNE